MLSDVWVYSWALLDNWAGYIWGALLISDVGGLALRRAQIDAIGDWLDQHVASERKRIPVVRFFLVLALIIAGFNAWRDEYQKANKPTESTEQQIQSRTAPLQSEIEFERQDNAGLHSQVNDVQAELKKILASMSPGLKKEMLELATNLTNRTFQILLIEGDHPPRSNIPPPATFDSKIYEKIVKDREDEVELLKGKQQQAHQDEAQLVSEYNNSYASRIVEFRRQCIQMGQTGWQEDEAYYQNAKGAVDIQQIGHEVLCTRMN
jgi:hypothetical protein